MGKESFLGFLVLGGVYCFMLVSVFLSCKKNLSRNLSAFSC
jgi:hypothetical protein